MNKLYILTSLCIFSFSSFLNAQTIGTDFYLNIIEPFYESIPSSEFGGADFGGSVEMPIYGELAYASNDIDFLACTPVNDLTGKIALADRGECEFGQKALNAEVAGAIAVIICNIDDMITNMAPGQTMGVTIPAVHLTFSQCETLKLTMDEGGTVVLGLSPEPSPTSKVTGQLVSDENDNCNLDTGEYSLSNFQVVATKNNYTRTSYTDADGFYNLYLDTGLYAVDVLPPDFIWENCADPVTVEFLDYDEEATVDFPLHAIKDCALLTVDLASPLLRRCFENNYTVNYCNIGSIPAEDAYVTIELHPFFTMISSSIPYTQDNTTYTFELGALSPGACGSFTYVAELSCDADLGMTLCAEANIFPFDRACIPTTANWDGTNIIVDATCDGEQVQFTISNDSEVNMSSSQSYTVLRNGQYSETGTFLLDADASKTISIPADGNTYRLEAEQSVDHPWNNLPSATIEACSTGDEFTTGFHLIFPVADYGDSYDELCQEVIGSFDPNDKQGFPIGYGEQHYIEKNVDLEYLIRFQNTGTDTAFKVVVTDEISEHLDMRSFIPGASSHDYTLDITGNKLQFTFDNIMLPDSFVNEAASNGWFEYRISQKINLDLETRIENTAAIYFDFNEPVITNTTFHTVGENFLPTSAKETVIAANSLEITPNPASNGQDIFIDLDINENYQYTVFDITGKRIMTGKIKTSSLTLPDDMQTGLYILKLTDQESRVQTGRFLVH